MNMGVLGWLSITITLIILVLCATTAFVIYIHDNYMGRNKYIEIEENVLECDPKFMYGICPVCENTIIFPKTTEHKCYCRFCGQALKGIYKEECDER